MTKVFNSYFRILSGGIIALALCSLLPVDLLQEIETKYEAYKEKYPSTKINLIFNQPTFAPGDTAFFSAWYQNEELLPIKGDHIVTLDLINGNGILVQKLRFKIKSGRGNNQIVFKSDLPPAEYKFVAYTDWMKNFGEAWYFQKRVQLVSRKKLQVVSAQDNITFYPEGGNLVEGLPNHVVALGPALSEATIKGSDNSEVIKIVFDSTGIANFSITPLTDLTYSANSTSNKKWALPKVIKDGLTVKMILKDTSEALISLPINSKLTNKELYAITSSRGKIVASKKFTVLPSEVYHLQLPLREKHEAYHQLFIFDSNQQQLAERIFIPHQPEKQSATIQVNPTGKQRQNIGFTVAVKDDLGYPIESEFSVTILQKKLFDKTDVTNSFYLSDLPDAIERVEKFGEKLADINTFLVTQTWKRIDWNTILRGPSTPPSFPFQSLITLTGRVTSKASGAPVPDSTVIISYLQKNTIGYESYTRNGKFAIPIIFDFWGDDQIFCTLQHKSRNIDGDYNIILDKDSIHVNDNWTSSETTEKSNYGEFAFNKKIISKSYSFFASTQKVAITDVGANSAFEEEFSGADATINIADYVLFPTMEDLLREVVPFVQFQQRGTRKAIKMSYRYDKSVKIYSDDPLYIIDGLMTRNTPFFLSIKPEHLISLKIINNPNKLAQLGRLGDNGIIFVESKKRDLNTLVENNVFQIAGQNKPAFFFYPDYSKTKPTERIPDLRSNYYWAPSQKTDKSGSSEITFFAGDDVGPVDICVRGLTKDRKPFSIQKTVFIEFDGLPK